MIILGKLFVILNADFRRLHGNCYNCTIHVILFTNRQFKSLSAAKSSITNGKNPDFD